MRTITEARITAKLDRALQHPQADNRHLRSVLRWSTNPVNAARATRVLDTRNGTLARELDREGHLDDYSALGVLFRRDTETVLPDGDLTLVDRALDRAVQAYAGIESDDDGLVPGHVATDPIGCVRAAYALSRDMATVEFNDTPLPGVACSCKQATD